MAERVVVFFERGPFSAVWNVRLAFSQEEVKPPPQNAPQPPPPRFPMARTGNEPASALCPWGSGRADRAALRTNPALRPLHALLDREMALGHLSRQGRAGPNGSAAPLGCSIPVAQAASPPPPLGLAGAGHSSTRLGPPGRRSVWCRRCCCASSHPDQASAGPGPDERPAAWHIH